MLLLAAWVLIVLGVSHVIFGLIRFKIPIREAIAEGFVGRFMHSDARRLAFWFVLVGPLLSLLGQVALRAIDSGDLGLIRTIGCYLFAAFVVGALAFPKSPLWALLPPSTIFIAAGSGWLA